MTLSSIPRIHTPAPPPPNCQSHADNGSVLGPVLHRLCGFLAQFRNLTLTGAAYNEYTGGSEMVLLSRLPFHLGIRNSRLSQ